MKAFDSFLHNNLSESGGHLCIDRQDATMLAAEYGTPLYVLDETLVRESCRAYVETMREVFPAGSMPLYASKALCFAQLYRIVAEEGMGTDLVSAGELYTAQKAGFPLENAFFHGNNKTDEDIASALDSGVGFFVADNREELFAIDRQARKRGVRQKILLRLTPGIDPHTHKAITTGTVDSKFGTAIETGQAQELAALALRLPGIDCRGFHCHVGSQVFDVTPFAQAAEVMLRFSKDFGEKYDFTTEYLNLGGGFGVRYLPGHPKPDYRSYLRALADAVRHTCEALQMPCPKLLLEPGRSIVGAAGTTLYTVGSVKEIPGYKNYVSVDGGMTDNPRWALYQAPYTIVNASRAAQNADYRCSVVGRCCESGDILQENVLLQKPQRGDILAVLSTGAYNYAMASHYNRLLCPAVVLLRDGQSRLVVRRETHEELTARDILYG